MTRASLLFVVAVVLISGCPRSRDSGGGGGPVPFESLPDEIAAAYCAFLFRCGPSNDDAIAVRLIFGDASTCTSYLARIYESSELRGLEAAIADGTVTYDAALAGECIGLLRSGCSSLVDDTDIDESCESVFGGTVAEGGTCWIDEECAGNSRCDFPTSACPGTCVPEDTVGLDCEGAMCTAGQECFYPETGTARCVTATIEPDAAEGQPCGLVEETDTTVTRRACMPGLWCTGDRYAIGTCRAPIAAGAACTDDDDLCVDGHVCAGGTCRAVTIVRTEGAPCSEAMLQVCDPLLRLECDGAACVRLGDGTSGSACETGDFGELSCNEGLVCHRDTMTCGAPRPAGAPCESGSECASTSCDFATGTCRDHYCDL